MAVNVTVDKSMVTRHWDIVDNSDVAVLTSTNFDFAFASGAFFRNQIFSIDNIENLFLVVWKTFKYDEITLRLFDSYNVNNLVFVRNFKWEVLFADFAVYFIEF